MWHEPDRDNMVGTSLPQLLPAVPNQEVLVAADGRAEQGQVNAWQCSKVVS